MIKYRRCAVCFEVYRKKDMTKVVQYDDYRAIWKRAWFCCTHTPTLVESRR
jgi:hypothetical protein